MIANVKGGALIPEPVIHDAYLGLFWGALLFIAVILVATWLRGRRG